MGMFDRETSLTKSDFMGKDFVLVKGEYLGVSRSADYGENSKARVTVRELDGSEERTFVVFGVLADQIQRMEAGDLPAPVRIGKDGRANVFEPVDDNPL